MVEQKGLVKGKLNSGGRDKEKAGHANAALELITYTGKEGNVE